MVTVSIRLDSPNEAESLSCVGLYSPDPAKPPIHGIEIHSDARRQAKVRLRVPENQAPGVYSGVILDERTEEPCGTLILRVPAA
jgi:hypothetical protein